LNALTQHFSLAEQVIGAIRKVIGSAPAVLHEPVFSGNEWIYVKECLDSTFVSSVGKFVDRFELDLASFTGARHAVAVVNGTAALHIALKLADVTCGDEVLIPALTFVATANAVTYCGATPHFVDSYELTLGVDADKLHDYLTHNTEQRAGQCINLATEKIIRALVPIAHVRSSFRYGCSNGCGSRCLILHLLKMRLSLWAVTITEGTQALSD